MFRATRNRRPAARLLGAAAVLALGTSAVVPNALAQDAPGYHVTRTVPLGLPDRWDYVVFDPGSHRVYVSHGDRVTVVDGTSGAIIGQVEGFPGGTHGIAVVAASGRGYTDDGRAGEAGSFDLATLKVQQRIKAAEDADAIAYDAASGHVFVVNGDPGTLTVIDPKADRAIATVETGGKLEYAVADGTGKLYVNGEAKKEIVRVDTRTNQVDAHWPIPNCESPHGLAVDAANHRLFSSCVNKVLVVVNTDTGAVVATLPIGAGTDAAAFDPKRKLVFSSNGRDGTLTVIQEKDANTFVPLAEIKTAITARTMAVDPASGRIYLVAADVDASAPAPGSAPGGFPRRPALVAGSTKLLFLDP
jgi:DNA-binding beta-propeller fold protein YncE